MCLDDLLACSFAYLDHAFVVAFTGTCNAKDMLTGRDVA